MPGPLCPELHGSRGMGPGCPRVRKGSETPKMSTAPCGVPLKPTRLLQTNIYIYIHIQICIYIYTNMCVYIYIHIYIYTRMYIKSERPPFRKLRFPAFRSWRQPQKKGEDRVTSCHRRAFARESSRVLAPRRRR